ncbi:hypothetical protein FRC18_010354 [Serendipita sp. 400]|nr:hypothetical protein FRC18_010354 [Serendipita sp. 400]
MIRLLRISGHFSLFSRTNYFKHSFRSPTIDPKATPFRSQRHVRHFASTEGLEPDFGDYLIVLPPDDPPFGVLHIPKNIVSEQITRPSYARQVSGNSAVLAQNTYNKKSNVRLGTDEETRMRRACALARETLDYAGHVLDTWPAVTTLQIDALVHNFIVSRGAYPSPLNYNGFPKSICTSVNNIISHGIPDQRPLQEGDIINIDVTVYLDGYHGDTSRSFAIGNVDEKGKHLLATAYEARRIGIDVCGPNRHYRNIGKAIHDFIHGSYPSSISSAQQSNRKQRPCIEDIEYTICNAFSGHGIGREFHTRPWIFHSKNDEPEVMEPGDCFTIEPIVLQTGIGRETPIWIWADGWTASTENGARGAVFEHTIIITKDGVDILT